MYYVGVVMLYPSSDLLPVCNGDQLTLTCSTSEILLRWNITSAQNEGVVTPPVTRTVSSHSVTSLVTPVFTNSVRVDLHRSSTEDELPLVSSLTISSVNPNLNGTLLTCMELTSSAESATTLIHIPENGICKLSYKLEKTK